MHYVDAKGILTGGKGRYGMNIYRALGGCHRERTDAASLFHHPLSTDGKGSISADDRREQYLIAQEFAGKAGYCHDGLPREPGERLFTMAAET